MNTLDILLLNTISYMTGVFTGLIVSYKLISPKNKKNKDIIKEELLIETEYQGNDTNKYRSPLHTSLTYPSAPPPLALNPEYTNENKKKFTITAE